MILLGTVGAIIFVLPFVLFFMTATHNTVQGCIAVFGLILYIPGLVSLLFFL